VLAGVLIAQIGAPHVVVLDALSYLIFGLLLYVVRLPSTEQETTAPEMRYHTGHAVQLLLGNPVLLSTTLMFLVFNIGNGLLAVWLPILADTVLHGGPQLYGGLLGVLALGEVLSALLAGSIDLPLPLGVRICIAQTLAGVALLLVLIAPNGWFIALALALFGVFSAPLTIWAQTLRMQIIPAPLRGRTFALLRMLMQSGNPVGGGLAGMLLPLAGMTVTIGLSAFLVGAPGLLGYGVRALRLSGGRAAETALSAVADALVTGREKK
jgi:hypothetical protein